MVRSLALGLLAFLVSIAPVRADAKLPVVATFSILGDLAKNVGGDRVVVETLVGPNADTHAYTPKPTDTKKLADAALILANGLGFETWIERLVASSGAKSALVQASSGATLLIDGVGKSGTSNPHAWHSVPNAKTYVTSIRDALIAADPGSKDIYRANAAAYLDQLNRLDEDIRRTIADIPEAKRNIVTQHPSFAYFGDAYGLTIMSPEHLNHEAETSAKTMATIIATIRRDRSSAIFYDSTGDPRLMRQIAMETGVKISGPLYADALTDKDGAAPTYIAMMRQNLRTIADALRNPQL